MSIITQVAIKFTFQLAVIMACTAYKPWHTF